MLPHRITRQNEILAYEFSSQILHLGICKIMQVDKTQASGQKLSDYYSAKTVLFVLKKK